MNLKDITYTLDKELDGKTIYMISRKRDSKGWYILITFTDSTGIVINNNPDEELNIMFAE